MIRLVGDAKSLDEFAGANQMHDDRLKGEVVEEGESVSLQRNSQ